MILWDSVISITIWWDNPNTPRFLYIDSPTPYHAGFSYTPVQDSGDNPQSSLTAYFFNLRNKMVTEICQKDKYLTQLMCTVY